MSPHEHHLLRQAEDTYWWYAVLHRLVMHELRQHLPQGSTILDAGCGTGGLLAKLSGWETHGVDLSTEAVRLCHERGLSQVQRGSVHALPFPDAHFDAVLSLDVLYHQEVDESRALEEMSRVLKPGGIWIANLPAFECLRGGHDSAVCGSRRYKSCHVRRRLRLHNLDPVMTHYWNAWLFFPLWIWRMQTRKDANPTSDLRPLPSALNRLLTLGGRADACLSRHLKIPFGSSLFVTASRGTRDL